MRLLIMLVLFSTVTVIAGKLPPIPEDSMRITAKITMKCALYKNYKIQIQMKEKDFFSPDEDIGKVWKFQSKQKKAKTVFIWGDTGSDGLFDKTLEVFFEVEHNCTPNRALAKVDVPVALRNRETDVNEVLAPLNVHFNPSTTYSLPLAATEDFQFWNLEKAVFQNK